MQWKARSGYRTPSFASTSIPRWQPSSLRLRRHEIGRQLGPLTEEIFVHLFDEKLLGLRRAKVEAVFVHEHLHMLDPHLPRLFGDVIVDLLPERMTFERHFVQAFHFLLKLYTEDVARAGACCVLYLVEPAVTASHLFSILLHRRL